MRTDNFWVWAMAAFAALCIGASCVGISASASGYEPPRCVDSFTLRYFISSTPNCRGIVIDGEKRRTWLCAIDLDDPEPQQPVRVGRYRTSELARYEARMRNAMMCR